MLSESTMSKGVAVENRDLDTQKPPEKPGSGLDAKYGCWRHVEVTDRRTGRDLAGLPGDMADVHFPGRRIVLVMDSSDTHRLSTTGPSARRRRRALPTASRCTTRQGMAAG